VAYTEIMKAMAKKKNVSRKKMALILREAKVKRRSLIMVYRLTKEGCDDISVPTTESNLHLLAYVATIAWENTAVSESLSILATAAKLTRGNA
jgi:hypothetical protein